MTELTITPKTADKTARFRGAVAAGEHVAVTIKGGAAWLGDGNGEHLSLRVLDLVTGRTLALFPRPPETYEDGDEPEEQDEWDTAGEDDADLFCNLNLNTDRMVNAARHMLRVPVLFVLGAKDEDNPATTRTLYFRDRYIVEFWPERVGDDTPYDLDKWPKQIDEWTQLVADWNARLNRMKLAAQRSTDEPPPADVPYTTITLNSGADGETDTVVKVYDGENGQDGRDGETTHEWVEERFLALAGGTMAGDIVFPVSSGQQSITAGSGGVIVTDGAQGYEFTHSGNATGPGTVARLSDVEPKYKKPQGGIPKSDLAAAVQTSLGKADTALQEHQSLAAYVNGGVYDGDAKKILLKHDNATVAAIDATAFIRDGMISEVKIVGDNLVVVFNADAGKESISIPLTQIFNPANYYDKTAADGRFVQKESGKGLFSGAYADLTGKPTLEDAIARTSSNAVKSSGIWAAIWGTLTALPAGVSSLYDWCVAQLAQKADASAVPVASVTAPLVDGAASPGSSAAYARGDHRHPTDISRAAASELSALAQTVTGKADAADLRYAKVQCVVAANPLPDAFFPITFTYNGVPYTASSNADLTYYGDASSYYVQYNLPGGGSVSLAYVAAGVWDLSPDVDDLAVNGCPIDEGVVVPLMDRVAQSLDAGAYTDSGVATVYVVPPPAVAGRLRDCIIDVDNSGGVYSANLEFAGLGAAYQLGIVDGNDVADLTTVEAGARARLYLTETAQTATPTGGTSAVPVISLQRLTVVVGGAA